MCLIWAHPVFVCAGITNVMKRAIVVVLDGCGAGPAPDAPLFGDHDQPSTIAHVWEQEGPLDCPHLIELGFFSACGIGSGGTGVHGRLREVSMGKDSVTGHWEMMGIVTEKPFPTYPNGFPDDLVHRFQDRIGRKVIGNKPASGTAIIAELGEEHMATGCPILYTSADSVFQIACHEEIIPVPELYRYCEIGRELCTEPNNVQRVIARPFIGSPETGFTRTQSRKDYPLVAPPNLVDALGDVYGIGVIPELFDGRGFRQVHRTQSNAEHEQALWTAMESDARFIWANFEDFDMLYGHRNDVEGFARCLERFDRTLGQLLARLTAEDLLILTADHGNDPTSASTDHSREYVPVVAVGRTVTGRPVGDIEGMTAIGATVAAHLGVGWSVGRNLTA